MDDTHIETDTKGNRAIVRNPKKVVGDTYDETITAGSSASPDLAAAARKAKGTKTGDEPEAVDTAAEEKAEGRGKKPDPADFAGNLGAYSKAMKEWREKGTPQRAAATELLQRRGLNTK